jgi:hypothetical protein
MSKTAPPERSRELDQFYTNPNYARRFLNVVQQHLDFNSVDVLLEPSAGTGNFYNILDPNKRIGLDLEPKAQGIIQLDFFEWKPSDSLKTYTLGNPPFGKNSNLAVKFFNHAAKFSDAIAFVLPRTFRKASIINRLDKHFHLIYEETVPDNSFIFNNKDYNVWCCAQIWVRKEQARSKIPILNFDTVKDWFEVVDPADAEFSFQRVGGRAGMIRTTDFIDYSTESHYFIKTKDQRVLAIFQSINFDEIKYNTAGNPSISPSEMIKLWIEYARKQGIVLETTKKD